jgi:hypothetical protein
VKGFFGCCTEKLSISFSTNPREDPKCEVTPFTLCNVSHALRIFFRQATLNTSIYANSLTQKRAPLPIKANVLVPLKPASVKWPPSTGGRFNHSSHFPQAVLAFGITILTVRRKSETECYSKTPQVMDFRRRHRISLRGYSRQSPALAGSTALP